MRSQLISNVHSLAVQPSHQLLSCLAALGTSPWPFQLLRQPPQCSNVRAVHTAPAAAPGQQQNDSQAPTNVDPGTAHKAAESSHILPQKKQTGGPSSTLTEEQLATLFDHDLQQRLGAAAQRVTQQGSSSTAAGGPDATSRSTHQQQQELPAAPSSISSAANSSTNSWSPQEAAKSAWQQPPAAAAAALPGVWNPLMSADPWAPLPSPAAARWVSVTHAVGWVWVRGSGSTLRVAAGFVVPVERR